MNLLDVSALGKKCSRLCSHRMAKETHTIFFVLNIALVLRSSIAGVAGLFSISSYYVEQFMWSNFSLLDQFFVLPPHAQEKTKHYDVALIEPRPYCTSSNRHTIAPEPSHPIIQILFVKKPRMLTQSLSLHLNNLNSRFLRVECCISL